VVSLQKGDTLVVSKLDLLGQTQSEVVAALAELQQRGVFVRTLDGLLNRAALGKMAPLVVGLLTGLSEVERSLIQERTRESVEHRQSLAGALRVVAGRRSEQQSTLGYRAESKEPTTSRLQPLLKNVDFEVRALLKLRSNRLGLQFTAISDDSIPAFIEANGVDTHTTPVQLGFTFGRDGNYHFSVTSSDQQPGLMQSFTPAFAVVAASPSPAVP
jgi:hypothetical protein